MSYISAFPKLRAILFMNASPALSQLLVFFRLFAASF